MSIKVLFLCIFFLKTNFAQAVSVIPWKYINNRVSILFGLEPNSEGKLVWNVFDVALCSEMKGEGIRDLCSIDWLAPPYESHKPHKGESSLYAVALTDQQFKLPRKLKQKWVWVDDLFRYVNALTYKLFSISDTREPLALDAQLMKKLQEPIVQFNLKRVGMPIVLPELLILGGELDLHNGYFTVDTIKKFLFLAHQKNKISNNYFGDVDKMIVEQPVGLKHGCTAQTFTVEIEGGPKYFIRKMASWPEAIRLSYCNKAKEFKVFNKLALEKREFPLVYLPDQILAYFYKNTIHCLSILPYAPGFTLGQLVDNYLACNRNNDKFIERTFSEVGEALACFHNHFMQSGSGYTIVHGDFSLDNVIYDETTSRVYFIDCDALIRSCLSKKPPIWDVTQLIFTAIHYYFDLRSERNKQLHLLNLICKSFLHSYFSHIKKHYKQDAWNALNATIRSSKDSPQRLTLIGVLSDLDKTIQK